MTKGAATPTFGITAPAFLSTSPLWSVRLLIYQKQRFQHLCHRFSLKNQSEYIYWQGHHPCLLCIVQIEFILQHIFRIRQICRAVKLHLYRLVCAPSFTTQFCHKHFVSVAVYFPESFRTHNHIRFSRGNADGFKFRRALPISLSGIKNSAAN